MIRYVAAVAAMAVAVALPASAMAASTPGYSKVSAKTSGDELMVSFAENGLQAGQNYAYTGDAASGTETFRCYTTQTFLPRSKRFTLKALATTPDVRGYTANRNGIVRGFIYLDLVLPQPNHAQHCPRGQMAVPVHVSYTNITLDDIFTIDVANIPGTVSGAIEPD